MNLLRTSRNITIIALILSLLFHASTVFYIFWQKTQNDSPLKNSENNLNKILEQQQEEKKLTPWVETKARAGNFGAPVFFEDIADEIPEETVEKDLPIEQTQSEKNEKDVSAIASAKAEETLLQENIIDSQQSFPEIEVSTSPQEEKKVAQTTMATAPQKLITKAPPKKMPTKQKTQTNPFINYPTRENKQKPPITLAQLTQGFLNQPKKQSGSYGISMLGMKQGIPSDEQIKYERYLQKLSWCLQNSFNIHRDKQPLLSTDMDIHLYFQLNRDGILEQLHVRKSSGNKLLDNFVVFVFREASHSFPPVPTYLPDDPFRMGYVISIIKAIY